MKNKVKCYIFLLSFVNFLLSEEQNVSIYLMEFENLDKNLKYNNLTRDLPNYIINEYSKFDNVSISYAGDIKPYLKNDKNFNLYTFFNFMILGSFSINEEAITIYYELIDYDNWMNISSDQLVISFNNLENLEKSFLDRVHDLLRTFIQLPIGYEYVYDIDENSIQPDKKIKDDFKSLYIIEKNVVTALDELEFYFDTYNKLKKIDLDKGQFGNRYYREFDLSKLNKQALGYEHNTEELLKTFDNILSNPYDVTIGEMDLNVSDSKDGRILVEVPVEYIVKTNLIDEMLDHLPHYRDVKDNNMILYEFSSENYLFSDELLGYLSRVQYQVTPIIFFNDKEGKIKLIIIDSWKDKYDDFKLNNVKIIRKREFSPLLAITPGTNNIQLNIDPSISGGIYTFLINGKDLGSYSKMTVKFIHENKLDEYLAEIKGGLK